MEEKKEKKEKKKYVLEVQNISQNNDSEFKHKKKLSN